MSTFILFTTTVKTLCCLQELQKVLIFEVVIVFLPKFSNFVFITYLLLYVAFCFCSNIFVINY